MSCQLVVASPLVVLSLRHPLIILSCQLVVALPLAVLSLRCPLVVLSCQLVVALPLAVLSLLHHPLVNSSRRQLFVALRPILLSLRPVPPSRPLVAPLDAPPSRCLVVLLCSLLLSCCASWLSRHHLLWSSRCTALSSSHCAGRLLCCLSLCRPLVLLS